MLKVTLAANFFFSVVGAVFVVLGTSEQARLEKINYDNNIAKNKVTTSYSVTETSLFMAAMLFVFLMYVPYIGISFYMFYVAKRYQLHKGDIDEYA